jgi:hypothetical protein
MFIVPTFHGPNFHEWLIGTERERESFAHNPIGVRRLRMFERGLGRDTIAPRLIDCSRALGAASLLSM